MENYKYYYKQLHICNILWYYNGNKNVQLKGGLCMFKNDLILDMVESLGRNIGKSIFDEKDDSEKIVIENFCDKDMLLLILKKMILENKYNEAENTLFKFANRNKDYDFSEIVLWFYNELSLQNDEVLENNNFSRDEINQGLEDFKRIFNN